MFFAVLVCSDADCAAAFEAYGRFDELEQAVCDACGCCLELLALGEASGSSMNGGRSDGVGLELVPSS